MKIRPVPTRLTQPTLGRVGRDHRQKQQESQVHPFPQRPACGILQPMKTSPSSLCIVNAHVVLPSGIVETDIGIHNGKIVEIAKPLQQKYEETLDARNLTVLPGVIDTQVHFREPGMEYKEDLATGSLAAIAGGVTTFFEMPNTKPNTTTRELLQDKLQRARGRAWADHAFFLGATTENANLLASCEDLDGFAGVKIFMGSSTGTLLVPDDDHLRMALKSGTRRVAVHAEDENRLRWLAETVPATRPHDHPKRRDPECARLAVQRLLDLAAETNRHVHVLHVNSAEELEVMRHHPARRLLTAEVTPQHLTMHAPECYDRLGTLAVMNPPIRDERHQKALWTALRDGTLTCIGSDHAPHTMEEKNAGYPGAPSGMPGVQTTLPVLLNQVALGNARLEEVVLWTAQRPAEVYQIAHKGRIAHGFDADLVLVDLQKVHALQQHEIRSRVGWSPWLDVPLQGWPVTTILRGNVVFTAGQPVGDPQGKPVTCGEPTNNVGK